MNYRGYLITRAEGREAQALDCEYIMADFRAGRDRAPDGSDEKRFCEARRIAAVLDRDHALAIAKHYRGQAEEMGK